MMLFGLAGWWGKGTMYYTGVYTDPTWQIRLNDYAWLLAVENTCHQVLTVSDTYLFCERNFSIIIYYLTNCSHYEEKTVKNTNSVYAYSLSFPRQKSALSERIT